MTEFVILTLVPMVCAMLAAMACALPGNFLVLRRQAMIGDAVAHVVLPGIVVAFLLTGRVETWAMLLGASAAAVLAVGLIELVRRAGRVEPGAAMGIVFTAMFAGGVLLLEASDTSAVHLDVEHALMGNLESLIWLDATGWASLADPVALAGLPEELPRLAWVLAVNAALLALAWRPLVLATFDEGHARALGLPVRALGLGLVITAALAAVAAFGAVGAILTIAMFICPPAAARLMTDRLAAQVAWSLLFAAVAAAGGVLLAGYGPLWLGGTASVSAAGMVAVLAGLILALAAVAGPCRRRAGAA
jgi:manganese/zinc/iron transport system permease protein